MYKKMEERNWRKKNWEVRFGKDTGTWWLASLICKSFLLGFERISGDASIQFHVSFSLYFFFLFFFTWWRALGLISLINEKEKGKKTKNALHLKPICVCSVHRLWVDRLDPPWYQTATSDPFFSFFFYVLLLCVGFGPNQRSTFITVNFFVFGFIFRLILFSFFLSQSSPIFSEWISVEKEKKKGKH